MARSLPARRHNAARLTLPAGGTEPLALLSLTGNGGYELRDVEGGVTPSSDRGAVLEDLGYGEAMYWPGPQAPIHALWHAVTMPALVLRTRPEVMPGFGYILPAAEADRFAAAVPSARVMEVDANHYTITTHPDSIVAIDAFLRMS